MTRLGRAALVATVLIGACTLTVSRAPEAHATREGSGELVGGTLGVGIEEARGARPVPVDARSPSLPRLVNYTYTPIPGEPGSLEGLCDAAGNAVNGTNALVFGWLYVVVATTRADRVISDTLECVAFPDLNDISTPPPPPEPPVTPTIGDVWRAIALPRPLVGANPVTRGVTGLETRMWSGGAQAVQVAVTIGAFTVVGTATVVEYRFSTDEGFLGASASPGDGANPAARHRFAFKGPHTLSVASVWRATVTMVGPGGAVPVPIDIETAVLTATVPYPVAEVRSRLVG